jgi:hypothetical protein
LAPGDGPADEGLETPDGESDIYTINYDGSGPLEIRVDIPLEAYQNLYFDDELWIRDADYTVRSGSTILTIAETRLETVSNGSHIIRAEFLNQTVEIPFTLQKGVPLPSRSAPDPAADPADPPDPVEGNGATLMILAAALTLCAGAAAIILGLRAARSHSNAAGR